MQLLEQLHDVETQNFAGVFTLVTDARVSRLNEDQLAWLQLGLTHYGLDDLQKALALATREDLVEIDLDTWEVRVRGLPVALGKTPLFYYAWYCRERLAGEGWVANPASNRPNKEEGLRLAEFMWQHGGHSKAISDLEQSGLKAKTLDQNRSKIKDDMAAALGEQLAARYLFDAEKHPDGLRTRYRISLPATRIRLREAPEKPF